jgi:guanylate kinase
MTQKTQKRKSIIFSAPSGSGKTTLVKKMMEKGLPLSFSISATSRKPRVGEEDAKDYYFLSLEDFDKKVEQGEFVEWEEVYEGVKYGTLKLELERIFDQQQIPVFDVDVVGGLNLKEQMKEEALALFVQVSNIEVLRDRLQTRATDSQESIQTRLDKAAYEMSFAPKFDQVIINDDLDTAVEHTFQIISDYLNE